MGRASMSVRRYDPIEDSECIHCYLKLQLMTCECKLSEDVIKCCFDDCENLIIKPYGHNAQPVYDGRCCHSCNYSKVLPQRFMKVVNQINNKINN